MTVFVLNMKSATADMQPPTSMRIEPLWIRANSPVYVKTRL